MYNISNGAIRSRMHDFLFDSKAIVMFALSLTAYEIFTNQIKCQKVKVKKTKNGTYAIQLAMFDSI